jgi:hypothetical protein
LPGSWPVDDGGRREGKQSVFLTAPALKVTNLWSKRAAGSRANRQAGCLPMPALHRRRNGVVSKLLPRQRDGRHLVTRSLVLRQGASEERYLITVSARASNAAGEPKNREEVSSIPLSWQ